LLTLPLFPSAFVSEERDTGQCPGTRITRRSFSLIAVVPLIYGFKPRGLSPARTVVFGSPRKTRRRCKKRGEERAITCVLRERGRGVSMGGAKAAAVSVLVVDDSSVDRKVVELLLQNHKGAAPFHGELL
jgi:hypothetical protein